MKISAFALVMTATNAVDLNVERTSSVRLTSDTIDSLFNALDLNGSGYLSGTREYHAAWYAIHGFAAILNGSKNASEVDHGMTRERFGEYMSENRY